MASPVFVTSQMMSANKDSLGKKHPEARKKPKQALFTDLGEHPQPELKFTVRVVTPRNSLTGKEIAHIETLHTEHMPTDNLDKKATNSCCSLL